MVSALGRRLCFSGGGYLRLLPIRVVERLAQRVRASGRPVMYYVHPRELSPDHPRVPMGAVRRFKSYVNLRGTEAKVRRLLATGPFVTLQEWIDSDAGRRVLDRAA